MLRVNDNDRTRQQELQELLGQYIPDTVRVSLIHEGLITHDTFDGCTRPDVSNQVRLYQRTDVVIVYGESPFHAIKDQPWYQPTNKKRAHYIRSFPFDPRMCAHGVLAQLFFASSNPDECVCAGLDAFARAADLT